MKPGMDDKNRKETEFAGEVDDILVGKAAKIDKAMDEDYRSNLDFARKIAEFREEPSPEFREGLKKRLLLKLAEKEATAARQNPEPASFWSWLTNLNQTPVWRTAAVTAMVAVLALAVGWRIGFFSPDDKPGQPSITGLAPAASTVVAPKVVVEGRAFTPKTAYAAGEVINIQFSFKNLANDTRTFPFPPEFWIQNVNGDIIRTFAAKRNTMTLAAGASDRYDLAWDQKDDTGKQVPPGDYGVIMPNIQIGENIGVVGLVESFTVGIAANP